MKEYIINGIILLLSTLLTFLSTWFWKYKTKGDTYKRETDQKIETLSLQISILNTQISPFWAAVQTKIVKDLTHPHAQFKEMDNLLLGLENLTITIEERYRLLQLIKERIISTDPEVSQSEKDSAKIMEQVMEKVVIEAKTEETNAESKATESKEEKEERGSKDIAIVSLAGEK